MLKRWDLSIWIKAKFTHFFGWSYVKNLQIKNRILVFFFFKCGSQECCPDPDFIVAEKEPPGGASIFLMQR